MNKREIIYVSLRSAKKLIDIHNLFPVESVAKNRIRMIIIDLEEAIGD